jgi:hypothetical protein
MITQERFCLGSWHFIGTLIVTRRWPLLIFRSLGQRSRSQWQKTYSHNGCHYNGQPIWGACMFYKQPLFKYILSQWCLLFYPFTFLPMISPLQTLITVVQLKPLAGDFMFILLASTTPYVSCTGVGLYTVCFCAAQLLQSPFFPPSYDIIWNVVYIN